VLSSMDRMVAYLIERYDGAFPPWLAPVQLVVLPVTSEQAVLAESVAGQARAAGLRAECDPADATLGARIRRAREARVPYAAVIGASEAASGLVPVRRRDGRQLPGQPAAAVIQAIAAQVASRSPGAGLAAQP